jgi:hypothetical protein
MYVSCSERILRCTAVQLFHCSCKIADKEISRIRNIGFYCSSDLVQYVFEKSTINISALCNSCEDMACCSPECILTFLFAGDNIHYEIQQFVSCIHLCSAYFTLYPAP